MQSPDIFATIAGLLFVEVTSNHSMRWVSAEKDQSLERQYQILSYSKTKEQL